MRRIEPQQFAVVYHQRPNKRPVLVSVARRAQRDARTRAFVRRQLCARPNPPPIIMRLLCQPPCRQEGRVRRKVQVDVARAHCRGCRRGRRRNRGGGGGTGRRGGGGGVGGGFAELWTRFYVGRVRVAHVGPHRFEHEKGGFRASVRVAVPGGLVELAALCALDRLAPLHAGNAGEVGQKRHRQPVGLVAALPLPRQRVAEDGGFPLRRGRGERRRHREIAVGVVDRDHPDRHLCKPGLVGRVARRRQVRCNVKVGGRNERRRHGDRHLLLADPRRQYRRRCSAVHDAGAVAEDRHSDHDVCARGPELYGDGHDGVALLHLGRRSNPAVGKRCLRGRAEQRMRRLDRYLVVGNHAIQRALRARDRVDVDAVQQDVRCSDPDVVHLVGNRIPTPNLHRVDACFGKCVRGEGSERERERERELVFGGC